MSASRCEYWWDDTVKYGLSVHTAPTAEPITVAEAKAQAKVDISDEDVWFSKAIPAARMLAEVFTKRTFVTTSWRLTLDQFPSWEFYLPRPRLVSVTSIKYLDSSGVQQTMSPSGYTVDIYTEPGRITPAYGGSWPSGIVHTNAVEVIYDAGYGAPSAVPASVKHALLLTVAHWYENREAASEESFTELPMAAKSLLRSESWGFLP